MLGGGLLPFARDGDLGCLLRCGAHLRPGIDQQRPGQPCPTGPEAQRPDKPRQCRDPPHAVEPSRRRPGLASRPPAKHARGPALAIAPRQPHQGGRICGGQHLEAERREQHGRQRGVVDGPGDAKCFGQQTSVVGADHPMGGQGSDGTSRRRTHSPSSTCNEALATARQYRASGDVNVGGGAD